MAHPRLLQLDSIRVVLPLSIAIFALDLSVRSARAEARSAQDSCIGMRRICHKPAHANPFRAPGVRALRGRNDIARLVSRSTRTHARARRRVPNGLIPLVDACVHARARAGMSRRTSAQLRSTCALDQTPAASACGVRGLQGHHVPTVLRYRECAMAVGGRDGDCVNHPHVIKLWTAESAESHASLTK